MSSRRCHLHSCLVGRVVGEKTSALTLGAWGKRIWKVSSELLVKSIPNDFFLFSDARIGTKTYVGPTCVQLWWTYGENKESLIL